MDIKEYTHKEWETEAKKRFGKDMLNWKFICPSCGHIASLKDWKDLDGNEGAAFSCVGRWLNSKTTILEKGKGPCNYAGGGFFRLNPITIKHEDGEKTRVFDFAPTTKEVDSGIKEIANSSKS